MKVIFLDNDGVICLSSEWGSRFKHGELFDKLNAKAVKVLNEILDETGAQIVISSDWRYHATLDELRQYYEESGLKQLPIGVTEILETRRAKEILSYVEKHPDITKWVAVDDIDMSELGENHFVCCPRSNEGIKQTGIKQKIIKILNE